MELARRVEGLLVGVGAAYVASEPLLNWLGGLVAWRTRSLVYGSEWERRKKTRQCLVSLPPSPFSLLLPFPFPSLVISSSTRDPGPALVGFGREKESGKEERNL